jgi:type II secretory ATPase GspE/PulE/Tfp pilus assembly ATPase PilB-like protein
MNLQKHRVKIPSLLERLDESQKLALQKLLRHERLDYLAEMLDRSTSVVGKLIAEENGLDFLENFKIASNATTQIPLRLIHEYQCLPIEIQNDLNADNLHLITVWPPDASMVRWIEVACGRKAIWHLTVAQNVANTIIQHFGVGSDSLSDSDLEGSLRAEDEEEVEEDEDAAIIRFVNEIIAKAVTDRATDIHFEPQKNSIQIRYRIDGQLVPIKLPENLVKFQAAIISRLKIMARLNISEKRRPQDGRIRFTSGPFELDIRLSTLPTMYGESISLRLLSQGSRPVTLEDLGLSSEDLKVIDHNIRKPHGIVLVTGPTGSGKSTSLSAFVRRIRTPERRIITVEDPVEYEIEGVNQSQVHGEIGFSFASALRHILRQDPDVIMIGEIRDKETADIAIRASLTGHLVLSSLHTNDAAGGLTRLVDMGIEPFLITSSVEMIVAQRLVRRLCPHCSAPANLPEQTLLTQLNQLGVPVSEIQYASQVKKAVGCDQCRNLGYKGRVGIFEILNISEEIHKAIIKNKSANDIKEIALKEGMRTLQQSAWNQVKCGFTSLEAALHFSAGDLETSASK